MIIRIHERAADAGLVLGDDVLGTPLPYEEKLAGDTIAAYWPGLDAFTAAGEPGSWTALDWAEHLNDPLYEHPFAASPAGDRRAVLHLTVRLAPEDRPLTGQEWSEVAHRIARAAGIEIPGDAQDCRWVALQVRPHRLDLIASLIRLDGAWQQQPPGVPRRLAAEARQLEHDLSLLTPGALSTPPCGITPLSDIAAPLAGARSIVELHAQLLAGHPQAHRREAGHRLEWLARRLLDLQHDITTTADELRRPPTAPPPAPCPPARPSAARTGSRRLM
ncbi:relaxase/mobilization nuclease [Streptomyces sp. CC208A]|uniref:relaxase/mobilization nuclease n=1 Tax=Streptomyces sp. CC208A TaxID=3044573 RepID=UPI0024A8FB2E|nr:relaxase/mobilization nuclease [Streptomyces sp. CC208A]